MKRIFNAIKKTCLRVFRVILIALGVTIGAIATLVCYVGFSMSLMLLALASEGEFKYARDMKKKEEKEGTEYYGQDI